MIASEHRLALPAGYQLGKYRFKSVLGAGGFGITYLADDHSLGRRVAIKELLPNDIATRIDGSTVVAKTKSEESSLAWARERFLEEGRALAACEHPNVVHVYEMIEANGTAYMVTKFEDGRSLAEWFTSLGSKPTEAELRGILEPLLGGLEKVHRAGFLHRDIKPENIYITDDGRPLLLDFGSARQAVTDRSALLTSIVTIGYAPFEQYYEDGKQGPWSDIYALAGVMYRAIHGEKPPEATRRLKNDQCIKLAKKYAGNYDAQFLNAIDKGLSVEHVDRPQTVAAWRTMLGKGAVAEPEKLSVPPQRDWREYLRQAQEMVFAHPRASASGAAVAVLLCGWAIMKALSPQPPVPTPHPDPNPNPKPIVVVTPTPPPIVKPESTPVPAPIVYITPAPATPPPFIPGPTPPIFYPTAPETVTMDPALVGTWTTKVKMGGGGSMSFHWVQSVDGHYSSSLAGGPAVDSGILSAEQGIIRRTSNITRLTVNIAYEIKSNGELVTNDPTDPNGPVTWKRLGSPSTASKERSSGTSTHSRSNSGETTTRHTPSAPQDWRQYIPKNLPSRFGF